MSEQQYTVILDQIIQNASQLAMDYYQRITSHEQVAQNRQIATDAAAAISRQMVSALQASFPADNIMDPTSGITNNNGPLTWVVNPLHGQDNFTNGIPHFGVSVGALDASGPLVGAAVIPAFSEVFLAERWKGATCNGARLVASGETELQKTLLSYAIKSPTAEGGPGFTDSEMPVLRDIVLHIGSLRTSDSMFDVLQVAKGAYGAALNQTATIYESVAQHILMVESGSVYTDFWGRPVDYSNPLTLQAAKFSYCAAPAALHTALQNLVRPYAL